MNKSTVNKIRLNVEENINKENVGPFHSLNPQGKKSGLLSSLKSNTMRSFALANNRRTLSLAKTRKALTTPRIRAELE